MISRFGLLPVMLAFAAVVFACLIAAIAIKHVPASFASGTAEPRPTVRHELALILRARGRIGAAFAAIALVAGAVAVIQVLAPLHLRRAGFSQAHIGWIFTIGAAISLAESVVLARVARRIDRLRVIAIALLAVGLGLIVLAVAPDRISYAAVVVALSVATLPVFVYAYPLCTEGADDLRLGHAVALGSLNTLWAAGALLAPVAAGALADSTNDTAAFVTVTAWAAATALVALRVRARIRNGG